MVITFGRHLRPGEIEFPDSSLLREIPLWECQQLTKTPKTVFIGLPISATRAQSSALGKAALSGWS
jgi:hypothetical protein